MVTCSVSSCKNSSSKTTKLKDGISFHRFPRHEQRRRQWEIAMNREEDWTSTPSSAVCSEHFESSDFYLTESGLRRLSLDAVPSINISACQQPEPTIAQLEPIVVLSSDSEEVIKLKHKVRRLEIIAENRKKRLHIVCQRERRLHRQLDKMKRIIKHLVKVKKEEQSKQGDYSSLIGGALTDIALNKIQLEGDLNM